MGSATVSIWETGALVSAILDNTICYYDPVVRTYRRKAVAQLLGLRFPGHRKSVSPLKKRPLVG